MSATAAVAACMNTADGTVVIPVLNRPPLPLPLPDPVRDGNVWATTLPWESTVQMMSSPVRFRRNLRASQQPTLSPSEMVGLTPLQIRDRLWRKWFSGHYALEPAEHTVWTSAPTSPDYMRGDAWGVVMPDAPMIEGANEKTKDQILSWFIDRYPLDFQKRYLEKYAGYGYSHFYLSPPDSLNGAGKSIDEFNKTIRLVKSYGQRVGLNMASKYFQPRLMSPDEFIAYLDPLLDAFIDEADEFVPAWEWDLWCITAPGAITIQRHVGQRAHAKKKTCWLHFGPHTTSWFADGDPRGRFGYWDDLAGDVDGINYQTFPNWTTQEMADRMVDTLWQFGQDGNRYKFRLWEDKATEQYNGYASPDDGDARGYYGSCTYDNVKRTDAKVWGFGNGGRKPDGSRI